MPLKGFNKMNNHSSYNFFRIVYFLSYLALFVFSFLMLPLLMTSQEGDVNGLHGYLGFFIKWSISGFVIVTFIASFIYLSIPAGWMKYMSALMLALILIAIYYAFFHWVDYGILDNFIFSNAKNIASSGLALLIDAGIIFVAISIAWQVCSREMKAVLPGLSIIVIACLLYAGFSAFTINEKSNEAKSFTSSIPTNIFSYSKREKNILVMMIDGSMSGYLPDLFRDNPELKTQMNGFTWYSNVVSPGNRTISGMPALMGGFNYTPSQINARTDGTLADKVSHAYELYPDNFTSKGYSVLYADPFWYGFKRRGDCERLETSTDATCFNLIDSVGRHETTLKVSLNRDRYNGGLMRQYLILSLFRLSPTFLKPSIYDKANWLGQSFSWRKKEDKYYINYLTLSKLPILSNTDAQTPTLTVIANNVTRATLLLDDDCQPLHSEISSSETLERFGDVETVKIYQTFICAMKQIGAYLEWFRAAGIWDNTMVVLVSDHGWKSNNPALENTKDRYDQAQWQCLLMIKPFGAVGDPVESKEFISNANVPGIVCDVIGGCYDKHTANTVTKVPLTRPVLLHSTPWQPSGQMKDRFIIDELRQVERDITYAKNWRRPQ